ncbi:unnamed protein product [Effrenium voratum]|nr:unnamed protein product [Effrenium voratum]
MGSSQFGAKCCMGVGSEDMQSMVCYRSCEFNVQAETCGAPTCCLAWRLGADTAFGIKLDQLQRLHEQVASHFSVFEASVLFEDASSGLIMGNGVDYAKMNATDSLIRMGQLLCRWALSQQPSIGIQVGVDFGMLKSVQGLLSMPNGTDGPAYFGPACAGARHLADTSRHEGMVHLSAEARDQLSELRFLPLILGSHNTYYLDAFTEAKEQTQSLDEARPLLSRVDSDMKDRSRRMSFEEFKELLQTHHVDLSKFGKGNMKSLQQFYDAVVKEEKCYLQLKSGVLHRFVELVRIHLRFRNSEGKLRELKIFAEIYEDGRERQRNQLLAVVLRLKDQGDWKSALERCFETKFGIPAHVQPSLFHIAKDAYKYEEYSADSETVPDMGTTYKTHNVFVSVKDRTRTELLPMGLPDGKDFTTRNGKTKWVWSPVSNSKEDELMQLLQKHGIDISEFTWQSFVELYVEVHEQALSTVEVDEDELVRKVRIIKIWLEANVQSQRHVLVIKTKQQRGRTQNFRSLRTLSMRMRALQSWQEAVREALFLRLGISDQQQREALNIELMETREEVEYSVSFPGLKTVYNICEVHCEVLSPQDQQWQYIGLPAANDFTFSRQEPIANTGEFDMVITRWGWTDAAEVEHEVERRKGRKRRSADDAIVTATDSDTSRKKVVPPEPLPVSGSLRIQACTWTISLVHPHENWRSRTSSVSSCLQTPVGYLLLSTAMKDLDTKRGVYIGRNPSPRPRPQLHASRLGCAEHFLPTFTPKQQSWPHAKRSGPGGKDELLIMRVMDGKTTDWAKARRAAEQIRSASYSTKDFYNDLVAAFPELRLYCVVREGGTPHGEGKILLPSISALTTSASRTGEDEYQRTIGALFCIFWLMRQHLDGKECFCFGLDNDWNPRSKDHFKDQELEAEYNKRNMFFEKTDWAAIESLLVGAGLLKKAGGPHDVERTLAMLVLMTIHDVMKLDILRPTVGCGEFSGYQNGEPIGDHDVALSYVLDRCPQALPSFAGLSTSMQESIKFTHCKLDYNMGWLVQAEAPPGALFKAFREVVLSGAADDEKCASNIAFYFVHWFADLAGAEAFPLQGCEKFVLKFPLHVLSSFIDSFAVVWNLGPKTETEVFEDYLVWRWNNMEQRELGPAPSGFGAVAKMRLVLMAQGNSAEIIRQFGKLKKADQLVLSQELAMSGCVNQKFKRDGFKEVGGPAILIYYSPALMQKAGKQDPGGAMVILAEIFRQARSLWPLSSKAEDCDKTVVVRIDVLKELQAMRAGRNVGHLPLSALGWWPKNAFGKSWGRWGRGWVLPPFPPREVEGSAAFL